MQSHSNENKAKAPEASQNISQNAGVQYQTNHPAEIIQRAQVDPGSLTQADIMTLHRTIGNQAVGRLINGVIQNKAIQRKDDDHVCGPGCGCDQSIQNKAIQRKADNHTCGLAIQEKINTTDNSIQRKENNTEKTNATDNPIQRKKNSTGMPDKLKSSLEGLSGMDLSDVKVHRNSQKPAQVGAHAYAQSSDIYLAPGQEKHLPHEGWHVVQQRQGRVKPTMKMGGVQINDDKSLESEADKMGAKALQMVSSYKDSVSQRIAKNKKKQVIQNVEMDDLGDSNMLSEVVD